MVALLVSVGINCYSSYSLEVIMVDETIDGVSVVIIEGLWIALSNFLAMYFSNSCLSFFAV